MSNSHQSNKNISFKIKWQPREKAAIHKLRRLGYSINQLSIFFGRSTSAIYNILKKSFEAKKNLRKLPNRVRLISAQNFRFSMGKWLSLWESFILGETDRPP